LRLRTARASASGREETAALTFDAGVGDGRGGGAGRRVDLKGVFSVLPTPFAGGGDLDLGSLDRVVELYVGAGVDGVTVLGVTGEVTRLTERERGLVAGRVIERVAGRVAVIVGTTADGLRTCIEYSRAAKAAGATAVMVSPPRMPRVNSDAVVRHYAALADAVDLPIVVQDYPPVSGFFMEPALLARIAREVPAARTIKLEDPPTPFKTSRILEQAGDVPVEVLGGLGGVFLLEELMAGAAGVMTGFAYPEVLVEVVRRFQAGDRDAAADVFYAHVPLMRFEFQEGIGMAIRKEVLRRRGALADASTRAPAPALDAATRAALDRVLAWTARRGGSRWISA
jgi:4-hydroxy-tetrahydrodipicolinate synthase